MRRSMKREQIILRPITKKKIVRLMKIIDHWSIEQQAIAYKFISLEILKADGQDYEDLFVTIQRGLDPSFRAVKPQGKLGDKKNDGFSSDGGQYFQVYAPEKQEGNALIGKLEGVFPEIKDYWDSIEPVLGFMYVINDKFRGTFPQVEKRLSELKAEYELETCKPYLAADLLDDFFKLDARDAVALLGSIPSEYAMEQLDYGIMGEVLSHIMRVPVREEIESDLRIVEFQEKIRFNGFTEHVEVFMKAASYVHGAIEGFFERHGNFSQSLLKDHVISEYLRIAEDGELADPDMVFFKLLDNLSPRKEKAVGDATMSVIAYFFEACDIFKKPELIDND